MNKPILPPKRFEDPEEPRFDPIRGSSWFWKMSKRRGKLPMLKAARSAMMVRDIIQKVAAEEFGVDERELRDYNKFVDGAPFITEIDPRRAMAAMDLAYQLYAPSSTSWSECLTKAAKSFGINERRLIEMWEVDPAFFPSSYERYSERPNRNPPLHNQRDNPGMG